MSARAMEGTTLASLVTMAIPLCRAAQRRCSRTGPGAPPAYADWQVAVLIMVAVVARRKSKSAQYRYLQQRRAWLIQRLGLDGFPARSTYFQRYRQAHVVFEQAVMLQGRRAITEGITQATAVAVDKSLIGARGPVWAPQARREGRCRSGVDRQAGWGYSTHHGWVYGYSYEVVVTATDCRVVFPLLASVAPANVSEHRSFGPKVAYLPSETRYVLADAGYDSNAHADAVEYDSDGRATDRHFVCPLQARGGRPAVGRCRSRGRREQSRQRRAKRWALLTSRQGRRLCRRRGSTVEPFNEWFKGKFDLNVRTWHRGICNNATQILASLFIYQLLIRYNYRRGSNNGRVQWILDAI